MLEEDKERIIALYRRFRNENTPYWALRNTAKESGFELSTVINIVMDEV